MEPEERAKAFETRLGTFVMRRETALDQLKIGRRRRALLGGTDADGLDWNFAHTLAGVELLAETAPDDLPRLRDRSINWDQVYDIDAILQLWREYQEWENSFLRPDSDSGDEGGVGSGESVDGVSGTTVS